ncbi:MAG: flavodoxin family protein [Desulfobacterales bacterium]|nr:flavodoxin family protein [Desulfobacterales bacterium]
MDRITAIYGSPRREGNTAALLSQAVAGARAQGLGVKEIFLRDLKMSPCLEIYGCTRDGECAIRDDFQAVRDAMLAADGIMLASPIFFYSVSAQVKILMDRFQSQWVKKHWIEGRPMGRSLATRKGLFLSAGATRGRKLFDGALLSVKYFFDVLDTELWDYRLYRQLDFADDIQRHPEYLAEAFQTGAALARVLQTATPPA